MVDKLNDKPITNKVVECTSTIQAGQSIIDNVLQIFIQKPQDFYSSVEQNFGRNFSDKSITHLFLSIDDLTINALNSDLRNRYYDHLQDTRTKS